VYRTEGSLNWRTINVETTLAYEQCRYQSESHRDPECQGLCIDNCWGLDLRVKPSPSEMLPNSFAGPSVAKDIAFGWPKVTNGCPEARAQRPRPSVAKEIAFVRPKVTNGCPEAQAQGPRPSVTKDIAFVRPKVTNGCSEAQAQRPRPSVTKGIAFVRPKVTNGCSEAQVRRPEPSGKGIAFGTPRRKRKPSPGAGVRVKREYVRRSGLYT